MSLEQERVQILQMVADKKISPAEAAELIAALETSKPDAGEAQGAAKSAGHTWGSQDPWEDARDATRTVAHEAARVGREATQRLAEVAREATQRAKKAAREAERTVRETAREQERRARDMAREARERGREAGSTLGQDISNLVGNLVGVVGTIASKAAGAVDDLNLDHDFVLGPTVEYTDVLEGTFTSETPTVSVENANGPVELRAHDAPNGRLELHYKVRAGSEAEARTIAERYIRLQINEQSIRLVHEIGSLPRTGSPELSVHVVVYLPRMLTYGVEVKTVNGRVGLEGLQVVNSRIETVNGRVEVTDVTGDLLEMKTGNGRIDLVGSVSRAEARSGNGRIHLEPIGLVQQWSANSGNGAVVLATGQLPSEVTVALEARTGMGSVHLDASGFEEKASGGKGNHWIEAVRPGSGEGRVDVKLSSGIGSITVE